MSKGQALLRRLHKPGEQSETLGTAGQRSLSGFIAPHRKSMPLAAVFQFGQVGGQNVGVNVDRSHVGAVQAGAAG